MEKEELQYTIINHSAREMLGLTIIEYCTADSIMQLGNINPENKGWCYANKNYFADFLHCTDRAIYKALNKLEEKGLIERNTFKNDKGVKVSHIRTTMKFNRTVIMKKKGTEKSSVPPEKSSGAVLKYVQEGTEKSSDNKDIHKDIYKDSNKESVICSRFLQSDLASFLNKLNQKEKKILSEALARSIYSIEDAYNYVKDQVERGKRVDNVFGYMLHVLNEEYEIDEDGRWYNWGHEQAFG